MSEKFGDHGDLVEQFLSEVTRGDTNWTELSTRSRRADRRAALRALTEVPYPAALLSAVDTAALRAFASLSLSRSDLGDPLGKGTVKIAVTAGAQALAVHDKLPSEHLEALLRPFAELGFESAQAVLASPQAH